MCLLRTRFQSASTRRFHKHPTPPFWATGCEATPAPLGCAPPKIWHCPCPPSHRCAEPPITSN